MLLILFLILWCYVLPPGELCGGDAAIRVTWGDAAIRVTVYSLWGLVHLETSACSVSSK